MLTDRIRVGRYYQTSHGDGRCVEVGQRGRGVVGVIITRPVPLGLRYLRSRDVVREIPDWTRPPEDTTHVPS